MALRALPFMIGFLFVPLVICAARSGAWMFAPLIAIYGAVPFFDALFGLNERNPSSQEQQALERSLAFRLVTWAWVPVHASFIVWALSFYSGRSLSTFETAGFVLSVGSVSGIIGITYAHELVHRKRRFERALADVLLALVTYPHWAVEHVLGHHRNVGLRDDPATARLGESFWTFLPRAILSGVISALSQEADRLSRRGVSRWHRSNRMWRYAATTASIYATIVVIWGVKAAAFFLAQGFIAVVVLEAVNYIEHYGLSRREPHPGRYERVLPFHSWESRHRLSNWFLINLARHADHHYLASRPYQSLEVYSEAPQLPAGYGSMMLLALVPPLWRRVMDPRARAAQAAMPPLALVEK